MRTVHRLILTNPTVLHRFVSVIGGSLPVFCQDAKYKSQKKNQDETKQARLSFSQDLIPPNLEMNIWCPLNQVFKPFGDGISCLVILLRWLDVRYKFCSFYVTMAFGGCSHCSHLRWLGALRIDYATAIWSWRWLLEWQTRLVGRTPITFVQGVVCRNYIYSSQCTDSRFPCVSYITCIHPLQNSNRNIPFMICISLIT